MNVLRAPRFLAVICAAFLLLATSAEAQLLSNLGSPTNGGFGGSPDSADDFVTGTVPLTINRIDVEWAGANGGVNQVGIYTDNGGVPSTTQVGTFFTNANPTVVGTMAYVGSAVLAANTTYWMVVDIVDSSEVAYTFTNTVASDPATGGATIPNGASAYGDNITGAWTNDPANLKFALFGLGGAAPLVAQAVPTLHEWSLVLMAVLMALTALGFRARMKR